MTFSEVQGHVHEYLVRKHLIPFALEFLSHLNSCIMIWFN